MPERWPSSGRRHWAGTSPPAHRPTSPQSADRGARVLRRVSEHGATWVVLADPEANEFCVALPHTLTEDTDYTYDTDDTDDTDDTPTP